jgi:catechol 2,3-dioxygenase
MAWRTASEGALDEAATRIEAKGVTGTWHEPRQGHGRSYSSPGLGHTLELYWEVTRFNANGNASIFVDRPEKRSSHGAAPRQLDHVTIAATRRQGLHTAWYRDALDFREMGFIELDDAPITVFAVLTTNEKSHDLGSCSTARPSRDGPTTSRSGSTPTRSWCGRDVLRRTAPTSSTGRPSTASANRCSCTSASRPVPRRAQHRRLPQLRARLDPQRVEALRRGTNLYRNSAMPMSMTESFPPDPGHPTATEEGLLEGTEDVVISTFTKQGNA